MDELGSEIGLELIKTENDIEKETNLILEPDSVNSWLDFYNFKQKQYISSKNPVDQQNILLYQIFILKRGTNYLRRSYKIFILYISKRIELIESLNPFKNKVQFEKINEIFDYGLINLNKFPGIWTRYLRFLLDYQLYNISLIQSIFKRALQSLPITQHRQIWELYLEFVEKLLNITPTINSDIKKLISGICKRYLKFYPDKLEIIIEKLLDLECFEEIIELYEKYILNNPGFISSEGKSILDVYLTYVDCLTGYAREYMDFQEIDSYIILKNDLKIENFLLKLMKIFPDQLGLSVVKLANYSIIRNDFIKAEDIFKKYIKQCLTIKDFKMIYDGFLEFKENLIKQCLEKVDELEKDPTKEEELNFTNSLLDMNMEGFEALISHREHYVYDILTKQDINNCAFWLRKAGLYDDQNQLQDKLNCFVEAIKSIKPSKAHFDDVFGNSNDERQFENNEKEETLEEKENEKINKKLNNTSGLDKLWITYAQIYEYNGDYATARRIYESAIKVPFINANDLTEIYFAWAEMEIGIEDIGLEKAIEVLEKALKVPDFKKLGIPEKIVTYFNEDLVAQYKVHKSIKLWSFYLDLVESTCDIERTKKAYGKILNSKILTPLILINYINFLEGQGLFKESFQIFETGLEKFNYYPIKFEIGSLYINKYLKYYAENIKPKGDKSLLFQYKESIKDLFEQLLKDCPSNLCKPLYLKFAQFEKTEGNKSQSLVIFKTCINHLHLKSTDAIPENLLINLNDPNSKQVLENYKDIVEVYDLYIKAEREINGDASARKIFEYILEEELNLPNFNLLGFVLEFQSLEVFLKDITRAREIFNVGTRFIKYKIFHPDYKIENLKTIEEFWKSWENFELSFGNEDTYADMLRVKRNIEGNR